MTTTSGTTGDDKIRALTTFGVQCAHLVVASNVIITLTLQQCSTSVALANRNRNLRMTRLWDSVTCPCQTSICTRACPCYLTYSPRPQRAQWTSASLPNRMSCWRSWGTLDSSLHSYTGENIRRRRHGTYSLFVSHYDDVIMTAIASQIISLTIVCSTVYSGAHQRKHQSSASLAFVWGIHWDRWIPRTNSQ